MTTARRRARPTAPNRDGFTLVETVVTVGLMALVAVALASAFTVIARTAPRVGDRADDARALLGLTNWLPQDVASTEPGRFVLGDVASPCGGTSGTGLLQLSWEEGSVEFAVDYRFVDAGPGLGTVTRFACVDGGTASSVTTTSTLERIGGSVPIDVFSITEPASGREGVRFVVEALADDGATVLEILDLDAYTSNVHTTLPSLPAAPTATTLPNQPPTAHDIEVTVHPDDGLNVLPLPVVDPDGPEPNFVSYGTIGPADQTFITPYHDYAADGFTTSGGADVWVGANPGSDGTTEVFTYEVVDEDGATATGQITITVDSAMAPSTSTTTSTTTTVPCAADIVSVSPATVGRRSDGRLDADVALAITSSGSCRPLVVSFDPDPTDTDATPVQLAAGDAALVTIGAREHVWNQPGPPPWTIPIELREGANGPTADTIVLNIAP